MTRGAEWRGQVRAVCKRLGRYTYREVAAEFYNNEQKWTALLPTYNELWAYLAGADFHVIVIPGTSHDLAVYEFIEGMD